VSSLDDESLETSGPAAEAPATFGEMPPPSGLPVSSDGPPGLSGEVPPPRRRRRRRVLGIVVIVLAVVVTAASLISVPYYALTPGSAQSVGPLIGVPTSLSHDHGGSVDLVDVEVTPMRLIDFLWFKVQSNSSIISSAAIQGPETNAQYNTEGVLDMEDAQQAAEVVALKQLGYSVTVTPNGVLLYALDPGSPADLQLEVGDVITSVGTTKVTGVVGLTAALAGRTPGQSLRIGYRSYPSGTPKEVSLQMGVWRLQGTGASAQLDCLRPSVHSPYPVAKLVQINGASYLGTKQHPGHATACLGVLGPEASYAISKLPFAINLNSEGIVGPSAGLAFTLGLIQKLDAANLTNGMQVAATGTMSVTGAVGAIGGIQQKTAAVRSAGASIFLVPPANYPMAKQYAGTKLKVFAVSSISKALSVLESFGGKVERPAQP
jgi:PDZ domain-containing protein